MAKGRKTSSQCSNRVLEEIRHVSALFYVQVVDPAGNRRISRILWGNALRWYEAFGTILLARHGLTCIHRSVHRIAKFEYHSCLNPLWRFLHAFGWTKDPKFSFALALTGRSDMNLNLGDARPKYLPRHCCRCRLCCIPALDCLVKLNLERLIGGRLFQSRWMHGKNRSGRFNERLIGLWINASSEPCHD